MFKNVAGQFVIVYARDKSTGAEKTGDAANITARISKDSVDSAASNDATPTEISNTTHKGQYAFLMDQAETNCDLLGLTAVSSTTDIELLPVIIYTVNVPTNFASMGIESDGHVHGDVKQWLGVAPSALNAGLVQGDLQRIRNATAGAQTLGQWLGEGVSASADSGTVTTLVDAALTQADDYWNGALLVFNSGTHNGHTRIVTDFDAATDTLTFTPAFAAAVDATDVAQLVPGLGWAALDLANTTDGLGALKTATEAAFTTQMSESYAADGVAPTPAQALFLIQQMLTEKNVFGTTVTVRKLDGSTTAMTFTLNSSSVPTSITRAT